MNKNTETSGDVVVSDDTVVQQIPPSPTSSGSSKSSVEGWEKVKAKQRPSYKDPRRELHPSSAVIQAGYDSAFSERAIKAPIFKSSTFVFANAEGMISR